MRISDTVVINIIITCAPFFLSLKNSWNCAVLLMRCVLCIAIILKLFKTLNDLLLLYKLNLQKDRINIYNFNLKKELICFFVNFILVVLPIYGLHIASKIYLSDIIFFTVIGIDHLLSYPDKKFMLLKANNLHIGFGAAISYYKNYLEMILPYNFSERVDNFESYHNVSLRKKLFILVPETCKIPPYLESNEPENIERCQELQKEEITHAGIKNRKYNITVYHIMLNSNSKGQRMAVEYAQPLKTLYAFKEKGIITETEMFHQRKLFTKTLKEFLKTDLYKLCEIIEFNDNVEKVSEVLYKQYNLHSEIV